MVQVESKRNMSISPT